MRYNSIQYNFSITFGYFKDILQGRIMDSLYSGLKMATLLMCPKSHVQCADRNYDITKRLQNIGFLITINLGVRPKTEVQYIMLT